jgi:hypothetical protein
MDQDYQELKAALTEAHGALRRALLLAVKLNAEDVGKWVRQAFSMTALAITVFEVLLRERGKHA